MHQVQTLTTLVTTITADTREDTEVTEDMEATVASAVMAVVTNALSDLRPTVVGHEQTLTPTCLVSRWRTACDSVDTRMGSGFGH
jgi:hypothetical protein